jgi:YD repeat-containing protein
VPASGLPDIVETAYFPNGGVLADCYQPSCFRPLWTRDALNRQTDYTWDPNTGDMLTRLEPADASGQRRKTIAEYSLGRLVRERTCLTDAAGANLTCGTAAEQVREIAYFGSTALPAVVTLRDGANVAALTTTSAYDAAGRLLSTDGPLPGTDDAVFYRYDAHGRRTWEIGPRGANGTRNATRTTYRDSDDKPVIVETGSLPDQNSTMLTVLARTDLAYDARRNPVRETVSASGATQSVLDRSYDLRNRTVCEARRMYLASLPAEACTLGTAGTQGPDRISRNVYDSESRLLQVQRAYGTPLQQNYASYGYSPNGNRTSVTDANGNRAELRYDGYGRQTRWVFPHPTQTGAVNEGDYELYGYDAAGNRTSLRKRDGTTLTYSYDNLNRLLVKTAPQSASGAAGYSVHYGYDIGNRQTFARFGSASGSGAARRLPLSGLRSACPRSGGAPPKRGRCPKK